MTLWRPLWLLTARAFIQFPRLPAVLAFSMVPPLMQFFIFGAIFGTVPDNVNRLAARDPAIEPFPTANYYEYIAPAIIFFTCVIGIANAGVALVNDFQNRYFNKVLLAPVNMWSILLGRLFSDGVRVYVQSGLMLLLSLAFKARVETGIAGGLLILALGTLFSIFTVGVLVTNVALKTKSAQAVQAIFPVFFILIFLTTSFVPEAQMDNDVIKAIVRANPAQFVVEAMQGLMFTGYDVAELGLAFGIIGGSALIGIPLTAMNFRRSVLK